MCCVCGGGEEGEGGRGNPLSVHRNKSMSCKVLLKGGRRRGGRSDHAHEFVKGWDPNQYR